MNRYFRSAIYSHNFALFLCQCDKDVVDRDFREQKELMQKNGIKKSY